jgi:hypothetical protein
LLKSKIKKIVEYYDASKRENVDQFTKPLLTTLLFEDEDEAKEIEESISDIIHVKLATEDLLHLRLEFFTPTKSEAAGDYTLGRVTKGKRTLHEFGLRDREISTNLFVSGITGSGKTTTVLTFLYQWFLEGKSAIVFDWKADYINLLKPLQSINETLTDRLWFFSVGKDGFKFNPLRPPESVDVLTWIETFTDMFIHAFGLREPSASILVRCLKELCGESDKHPTLAELRDKVHDYQPLSNYDRESKRSILTRLMLMTEASLGPVFSTRIGVKLEDMLKKFVVLDLSLIPLLENKRFLIEVIYGMVYEYLKAKDDRTKTKGLFVIEEAHNVFGPKTNFDKDIMLKPEVALCEMRDFGWGTIVVDQQPSKLSSEVMANTATKICHKLVRKEDREAIRNAMGLNEEQSEYLGLLSKGEVFVKLDRDSFPYTFHARIKPVTFTGQVTRNEIKEYMQSFFETYPIDNDMLEESEEFSIKDLRPTSSLPEKKPPEIHPEQILEKSNWSNSVKNKIQNLTGESGSIIILLGEGSACKSSDFKHQLRMTGRDFKQHAITLAKKGLIGFKRMKAPGNPIFYFLRPEGLAAFHILTRKWPCEIRGQKLERKHSHSEMKEHVIEKFRKVGWKLAGNKVESGYVDVCLKRDDLTIPVEICTGSNKYEQIYHNILKCVEDFGGVYFVCDNEIAYNLVLQQASKFSFDYGVSFILYVILYENFLEGKKFEKYEF